MEIAADAVPQELTADYLLEPAEPSEEEEEEGEAERDNEKKGGKGAEGGKAKKNLKSTLVIFAVDISGSMSSTTEVPALQGVCVRACEYVDVFHAQFMHVCM